MLSLAPLTADRAVVLVGGQAVSFWTNLLGVGEASPLHDPLASKDIDFEGSARAARRAAALLDGSTRIPTMDEHTPNTGIVVFTDSGGVEREIDFIDGRSA